MLLLFLFFCSIWDCLGFGDGNIGGKYIMKYYYINMFKQVCQSFKLWQTLISNNAEAFYFFEFTRKLTTWSNSSLESKFFHACIPFTGIPSDVDLKISLASPP